MLWIISGPTSVGKSAFIASSRSAEITGLSPATPTVFPSATSQSAELGSIDAFYHYNILRPVLVGRRARRAMKKGRDFEIGAIDFDQDAAWTDVAQPAVTKQAIVLVAGKQALIERTRQRERIEDPVLRGQEARDYPAQKWLKVFEQVDL